MAIVRIPSLSDLLFGLLPKDKMVGLEIFTRQSFAEQAGQGGVIRLKVAPQNIQFTQRSRISEQVIKDGRAFFFWKKDRDAKHLDLLEIRLSGITRGLHKETPIIGRTLGGLANKAIDGLNVRQGLPPQATPQVSFNSDGESTLTVKQQHWLRFWRLTREPFVTATGLNPHSIALQTPALPHRIQFDGHFASPLEWEENADNPFLVNWRLTLIVHRTEPSLDKFFEQAITTILEE